MPDDADRARWADAWRNIMQFDPPPITDPYTEFTVELFDRVWGRPGLGRRERRLVSLTAVALSGQRDPLVNHLRASLDSEDLTVAELDEWVVHLAHYGGWPIAATAYGALREVAAGRS